MINPYLASYVSLRDTRRELGSNAELDVLIELNWRKAINYDLKIRRTNNA